MNSWAKYFFGLVKLVSEKSKDRSTKVGAIIVDDENSIVSTGYNGFPRGVYDHYDERHERPEKYLWTEHAERNAIYNAARRVLKGTTMYLQYGPCPCADCSRAIIQCGIKEIVIPLDSPFPGVATMWSDSMKVSYKMLREGGVVVRCEGADESN